MPHKPRLGRDPEFFFFRFEVSFDPQAVSEGEGLCVDSLFKANDLSHQL
jgi:hypothetical protein